jgi:hypothetical protein
LGQAAGLQPPDLPADGLALVTAHPGQVGTLAAHEPPVIELLPDRAQVRAQIQDIYDTYRAEGAPRARGSQRR